MSWLFLLCYTAGTHCAQLGQCASTARLPRVAAPTLSIDPALIPSIARRFGALFVDWIMCVLVSTFFGDPSRNPWVPLVLAAQYAFFIGLFAQTPGMWVFRLRCVSITTSGPPGILRAAIRGLLLILVVPGLIMNNPERRGWHDRVAGTVVVSVR